MDPIEERSIYIIKRIMSTETRKYKKYGPTISHMGWDLGDNNKAVIASSVSPKYQILSLGSVIAHVMFGPLTVRPRRSTLPCEH